MPEKEEFDPNSTFVGRITKKKNFGPMAMFTTIATIGGAIIALNAFTGLNFRPAWGHEIEQLVASDRVIQGRLDAILKIQDTTSKGMLELRKGQLGLKVRQIDRQKRELRRELAEYQSQAQIYRDKGELVPGWMRSSITDTEITLDELKDERIRVGNQQLELAR